MDAKNRKNKRPWAILINCFFAVLTIQYLFDPITDVTVYFNKTRSRINFPSARDKWDEQNFRHYKYDVTMFEHNSPCLWQGNLEIRDGVVVAAGRRSDWPADLSTLDVPVFPLYEPKPDTLFLCNYHNFTMPLLFEALEGWWEKPTSIYLVTYDRRYGFISELRYGYPSNRGLLRTRTWHCCNGFTIQNFQVLDD